MTAHGRFLPLDLDFRMTTKEKDILNSVLAIIDTHVYTAAMSYLGAKTGAGVYQAIINLMPPHDTYIEAFFGTGAIMDRKIPAINNIGIDFDTGVGLPTISNLNENWPECQFDTIEGNSISYLVENQFDEKTLIYCDPPYVHSTRTSKSRYQHELTDDDHRNLLAVLRSLDCMVMLSGYRNPIYEELISDWFSVDFQAMTRGGVRTETVWCNFEPADIHYHTFAGDNFTDRQRIKRKAERWANRFEKLPAGERQAVLAAMLACGTS